MKSLQIAENYLKRIAVFGNSITRNEAKADYTTVKRLSKTDNSAKKFTLLVIGCVLKGINISKRDAKKYYQLCTTLNHRSDEVIAEKILAPFVKAYGSKIRASAGKKRKVEDESEGTEHFIKWTQILEAVKDVLKVYGEDALIEPNFEGAQYLTPMTSIDFGIGNDYDGFELHGEIFPKVETGEMIIGYYDYRSLPANIANPPYEYRLCSTHPRDVKTTLKQLVGGNPQSETDGFL